MEKIRYVILGCILLSHVICGAAPINEPTEDVQIISMDEASIVYKTNNGACYVNAKTGDVMQMDFDEKGYVLFGVTVGENFVEPDMPKVGTTEYLGKYYHSYRTGDGKIFRVTVREADNIVTLLSLIVEV